MVLISVTLAACVSDLRDTIDKMDNTTQVRWNPEIAIPLVYSNIHPFGYTEDLDYIRVLDDGTVSLYYNDTIFSKTAEEAIPLDDQTYTESVTLDATQLATLTSTGQLTVNFDKDVDFNYAGNEVDRILYKGGSIQMRLSSTLQHDVSVNVVATHAKKAGVSFDETIEANYSGTVPVNSNVDVDLNGYEIDFTQTPQGHSGLNLQFDVVITRQGMNPVNAVENITFEFELIDQRFQELDGYVSNIDLSSDPVNVEADVYSGDNKGRFTLADPRVKLIFGNSMGIDIDANITRFDGVSETNNTVTLSGYPSPLPIPTATTRGVMVFDSFELNNGNSNLPAYINNLPINNYVEASIMTNAGSPSTRNWFIDTSGVQVEADIVLPLYGTATGYEFEQNMPFELGMENEVVEMLLMRLYTENGLPLDVAMQVYFEDSTSNTLIDSLFTTDLVILPAGNVDGTGRVTSPNPKTTDVEVDGPRFEALKMANRVRVVGKFDSVFENGSQPDVRIHRDDDILLQLGIQAKILFEEDL